MHISSSSFASYNDLIFSHKSMFKFLPCLENKSNVRLEAPCGQIPFFLVAILFLVYLSRARRSWHTDYFIFQHHTFIFWTSLQSYLIFSHLKQKWFGLFCICHFVVDCEFLQALLRSLSSLTHPNIFTCLLWFTLNSMSPGRFLWNDSSHIVFTFFNP